MAFITPMCCTQHISHLIDDMAVISFRAALSEASLGSLLVKHIKMAVHPHTDKENHKNTALTWFTFLKTVSKFCQDPLLSKKL